MQKVLITMSLEMEMDDDKDLSDINQTIEAAIDELTFIDEESSRLKWEVKAL